VIGRGTREAVVCQEVHAARMSPEQMATGGAGVIGQEGHGAANGNYCFGAAEEKSAGERVRKMQLPAWDGKICSWTRREGCQEQETKGRAREGSWESAGSSRPALLEAPRAGKMQAGKK
jgi:hypothetical protein